jgi:hypothetical protein
MHSREWGGWILLGRFQLRNLETNEVYVLARQLETLGSREKNTVILQGEGVSRYHCKVEIKDDQWMVKDLDSRNGIKIAGSVGSSFQDSRGSPLRAGTVIQIGSVELVFEERGAHVKQQNVFEDESDSSAELAMVGGAQMKPIIGALALLVVVVLGFMAFSGSSEPINDGKAGTNEAFESYEEALVYAIEKLEDGDNQLARRVLGIIREKYDAQPATEHLAIVIELWNRQNTPRDFPWDQFVKALAKLQTFNVPLPVDRFAKKYEPGARINQAAFHAVKAADKAIADAKKEINGGRTVAAVQEYHKALQLLQSVAATSVFSEEARKSFENCREAVFSALNEDAESQLKQRDWPAARRFLIGAQSYANDNEARKQIAEKLKQCDKNISDEGAYSRAVAIISKKDVRRYGEALRLLRGVGKESDVYSSSKAWADWCEADLSMRRAVSAFSAGNGEVALKWLKKTIESSGIQESTRQHLVRKRKLWKKIIEAYKKGEKALAASQFGVASERFAWIMKALPESKNVYHRLAEAKLDEIDREKTLSPGQLLVRSEEALVNGQFELGYRLLIRARKANRGSKAFEKKAQELVDRVEKKSNLLLSARKVVLGNKNQQFAEALAIAQLLKDFLPVSDRRRKRAAELCRKLNKR